MDIQQKKIQTIYLFMEVMLQQLKNCGSNDNY